MFYTDETKNELEEIVRSIDGVTNILWRWDPWDGCTCLKFKLGKRVFRVTFCNDGIPVAYYYLEGYWRINARLGNYSPHDVKQVVNTLCVMLDQYDTLVTREQIASFVDHSGYDYSEIFEELEEEKMVWKLAGEYIREHKIEDDEEGILLAVVISLFYRTMGYDYEEWERRKSEQRKKRRAHKKETVKPQKRRKKKKRNKKKRIKRYVY